MPEKIYGKIEQSDDYFHKEIVETFFGKSVPDTDILPKKAELKRPEKKQVVLTKIPSAKKNLTLYKFIPMSFLLFLAVLVIGGVYFYFTAFSPDEKIIASQKTGGYTRFLYSGDFNRSIVSSFYFEGDAREKSVLLNNSIKLINSRSEGWARAVFNFTEPVDFSKEDMLIFARSEPRTAQISVALVDENGNKVRSPVSLTPSWEWRTVGVKHLNNFDLSRVNAVMIEFGYVTTGNLDNSVIYIKNFGIRSAIG